MIIRSIPGSSNNAPANSFRSVDARAAPGWPKPRLRSGAAVRARARSLADDIGPARGIGRSRAAGRPPRRVRSDAAAHEWPANARAGGSACAGAGRFRAATTANPAFGREGEAMSALPSPGTGKPAATWGQCHSRHEDRPFNQFRFRSRSSQASARTYDATGHSVPGSESRCILVATFGLESLRKRWGRWGSMDYNSSTCVANSAATGMRNPGWPAIDSRGIPYHP
jgi:hypothetical protein